MKRLHTKISPGASSRLQPTANNVVLRFPTAMLERMRASSTDEARARYAKLLDAFEPVDQASAAPTSGR